MPGFDGLYDMGRNAERGVDLAVLGFGSGGFPDFQYSAVRILGENDGDDLMRTQLLANGPPRGMNARLQEPMLDGGQQMVSQNAKENVGLCPVLQMMKDRPLHQRTLDITEGIFHSS